MKAKRIITMVRIMLIISIALMLTGCDLPTVSSQQITSRTPKSSADALESGLAYVWYDPDTDEIQDDLHGDAGKSVFYPCIMGRYNFKRQETSEFSEYPRTIWIDSSVDEQIPTVTGSNALLYISDTDVPDEIVFERFADYGYTIGIANLSADGGGHYYIQYANLNKDDWKYYVDKESDAGNIQVFGIIEKLYLDRVGDIAVNADSVSDGGTVLGLKEDNSYVCEFYTGTYYQDFLLTSNIHTFGSMERFVSHDYTFLHSSCIRIGIPEYLKSGYYLINGVGLFRYVSKEDEKLYENGSGADCINWNEPVIQYDAYGNVLYDPSVDNSSAGMIPDEIITTPETAEELSETSDPGVEYYEPEYRQGKGGKLLWKED